MGNNLSTQILEKDLESLVNTCNLVQNFVPKQADIDKILKVIQRKVLRLNHPESELDTKPKIDIEFEGNLPHQDGIIL